jgi:DNA modification methylase
VEQSGMSDVQLYCGDCLEILPTLEAGSVDAVVTDPPYNIGFKYKTYHDKRDDYGDWIWQIISLCESLCVSGSPVFVWQAMEHIRMLAQWFPRDWRIFAACKSFVQMRPIAMQHAFEPVLVWWTPGDIYSQGTLSRDWYVANTSNTMNRKDGDAKGHPCARPLDQIEHILTQWVRPGGCVLDPFMGSGTTGVACVKTGRRFIGIEIDPHYFEIAEKRIAEAEAQPVLPGLEAVQHGMFEDK